MQKVNANYGKLFLVDRIAGINAKSLLVHLRGQKVYARRVKTPAKHARTRALIFQTISVKQDRGNVSCHSALAMVHDT